jgi:large subunit ribosomal protein L6
MSRIGKQPVPVPKGVEVASASGKVTVKGPKGSLELVLRPEIQVDVQPSELRVSPKGESVTSEMRAYHGMTRALLSNMVKGVTQGYQKSLEVQGVGWNAQSRGKELVLSVGYCKPVVLPVPAGLQVETPKPTAIVIRGADKQLVGLFAAQVRASRPPEPYKGKGVRYEGEYVRRKQGKSFGS